MVFLLVGTVTIYAVEQSRQAKVRWEADFCPKKTENPLAISFQIKYSNIRFHTTGGTMGRNPWGVWSV